MPEIQIVYVFPIVNQDCTETRSPENVIPILSTVQMAIMRTLYLIYVFYLRTVKL